MRYSIKIINNISYNIIGKIFGLVISLAITPFIVRKLGVDAYGLWMLVSSIVGYFVFLEFGFGDAGVKFLTECIAKEERKLTNKFIGTIFTTYVFIGFIGFLILVLLIEVLATKVLKIPSNLIDLAKFVFYLGAIGFFINMSCTIFNIILRSCQRFDIINILQIALNIIRHLFIFLLLFLGLKLKSITIFQIIMLLVSIMTYYIIVHKRFPDIKIHFSFKKEIFIKILKFGFFIGVVSISGVLVWQIDRFIIGAMVGSSAVTYFAIPSMISFYLIKMGGIITPVIFPSASELSTKRLFNELRELYIRGTKNLSLVMTILFIIVFVFADKILLVWMGGDFPEKSTAVLRLTVSATYLTGLGFIANTLVNGIGNPQLPAIFSMVSAPLNICLCILLTPKYGINGVALSVFFTQFILIPFFVYFANRSLHRLTKLPLIEFIKRAYLDILLIGSISLISAYFLRGLIRGFISLFAAISLTILIYLFFIIMFKVIDDYEITILRKYKNILLMG